MGWDGMGWDVTGVCYSVDRTDDRVTSAAIYRPLTQSPYGAGCLIGGYFGRDFWWWVVCVCAVCCVLCVVCCVCVCGVLCAVCYELKN